MSNEQVMRVGFLGRKHSIETKKKMSEAAKRRSPIVPGTMLGKKHSEEAKLKMSQSHRRCLGLHLEYDWLYENYIVMKNSTLTLAAMCGCTDVTILKHLRHHGLVRTYRESMMYKKPPEYHGRRKGSPRSEETKQKISESLKALHLTHPPYPKQIEAVRRIATGHGTMHSEEWKAHLRTLTRERNPNWKGGIGCRGYPTDFTSKLRKEIAIRDHFTCQHCNLKNPRLWAIHHIDYDKLNCDPSNLIFLCRSCNGRANGKREFHQQVFKEVMACANRDNP